MGLPPIKPPSSRRDNPDYNNHTLPPPHNTPKSPAPKAYCKAWASSWPCFRSGGRRPARNVPRNIPKGQSRAPERRLGGQLLVRLRLFLR